MSNGNDIAGSQTDLMAADDGNISSPKQAFATAAQEAEELWTATAMEEAVPYPIDIDEGTLVRAVEAMAETPELMEAGEGGGSLEVGGQPEVNATSEETAAAA